MSGQHHLITWTVVFKMEAANTGGVLNLGDGATLIVRRFTLGCATTLVTFVADAVAVSVLVLFGV